LPCGVATFTGPESFCQWFRGAKLTLDTSFERAELPTELPTGRSTDEKQLEAKAVGQEMASEKFAFSSSSTIWLLVVHNLR
jgi:hypothetical protein